MKNSISWMGARSGIEVIDGFLSTTTMSRPVRPASSAIELESQPEPNGPFVARCFEFGGYLPEDFRGWHDQSDGLNSVRQLKQLGF